jgi:hypothetical protein
MTGGRAPRQKGNRTERAIVRLLQERGLTAERVPLSGAARGRFGGDVSVPVLGVDRRIEVKCRHGGFRELYKWLAGADFLIVRADRRELLVVAPLKFAIEVVTMAESSRRLAEAVSPTRAARTRISSASVTHPETHMPSSHAKKSRMGRSRTSRFDDDHDFLRRRELRHDKERH